MYITLKNSYGTGTILISRTGNYIRTKTKRGNIMH